MILHLLTKYLADLMTKPRQAPVFGNPKEFGLNYEDVTFRTSDGLKLSGWLVKGNPDKVIILTHFGIHASRSGYTPRGKGWTKFWPQDIHFLKIAQHLVKAGYSVLLYDLRNHGESEENASRRITGGAEEAQDVIAAVKFISEHPAYRDNAIGLLSLCMGANATTYAYGLADGLKNHPNVKALIAVQPVVFADFMRAFGVPNFLVKRASDYVTSQGGVDFYRSPLPHAKDITVPILLTQNQNDPWTNLDWVRRYYDALKTEKEMLWLDGPKKRLAAYDHFAQYPEKMLEFFGRYVKK